MRTAAHRDGGQQERVLMWNMVCSERRTVHHTKRSRRKIDMRRQAGRRTAEPDNMDREEKATRKVPRRKAGKRKEKRREGAEGTGAPQSKFYEKHKRIAAERSEEK